jgi:hypothetical protein
MLYEIKALKAPWPKGAKVGDVIDMPYLPAWAEGKCSVALDNAKADFAYDPREAVVGDAAGAVSPSEALHTEIADLKAKLAAAEAARDDAVTGKATADAEAQVAREKLAAAEAALAAAKPKGNGR